MIARLTCPSKKISKVLNFILDTGSEVSFLGWQDALELGIDVDDLPASPKPVSGFGGPAEAKQLSEPCFLYIEMDGQLVTVELPTGMLIYHPSRVKSRHWKSAAAVSILGRDFLTGSGLTLKVNLSRSEMYLETV